MGRPGATPRRLGLLTAPGSVSHARNFVRDALVTANVGTDVVERATLLVSELVTNTVVHTFSSSVEITVRSSPVVRVEVRDWSDGLPEMLSTRPRDPPGHGLSVVEALASRWGVDPLPDGKAVWIEFDPSD